MPNKDIQESVDRELGMLRALAQAGIDQNLPIDNICQTMSLYLNLMNHDKPTLELMVVITMGALVELKKALANGEISLSE